MASYFQNYFHVVTRTPSYMTTTIYSLEPNLFRDTVFSIVLFAVIAILSKVVPARLFPKWYESLAPRKRGDLISYVTATAHHLVVAPMGLYFFYRDAMLSDQEAAQVDYLELCSWMCPFILGYFIIDTTTYALPEAFKGNFEYIIHHGLSLCLLYGMMGGDNLVSKYYAHMCMCEMSSLVFNLAWFLRTANKNALVFELLFAFFFFFTRIVNMPLAIYAMMFGGSTSLGWAGYTLYPIQLMQFFWFFKIVKGLAGGRGRKKSTSDEKSH